jgi:hypothetical protein
LENMHFILFRNMRRDVSLLIVPKTDVERKIPSDRLLYRQRCFIGRDLGVNILLTADQ